MDKFFSAWWANYTLKHEAYVFNILLLYQPPEDISADISEDKYSKNLKPFSFGLCTSFLTSWIYYTIIGKCIFVYFFVLNVLFPGNYLAVFPKNLL